MKAILTSLLVLTCTCLLAQQVPDTIYIPVNHKARYSPGKGPVIQIDEAHHNFHTAANRFLPFAKLLHRDGYIIKQGITPISKPSLKDVDVLVISNALNEQNINEWTLPNPSAFIDMEISVVKKWVADGGSLLLIADHMPFPGAAAKLSEAFGFTFHNGFALTDQVVFAPDLFSRANGRLKSHPITEGLDSILTFTGQGFDIPEKAKAILELDTAFFILLPETAWQFSKNTYRIEGKGKHQGATLEFGKGRIAVFGEAASFTAQISQGMFYMGFNHPQAKHNANFVLNVIHWLSNN